MSSIEDIKELTYAAQYKLYRDTGRVGHGSSYEWIDYQPRLWKGELVKTRI